mmetsp:Transcript_25876/g.32965  ORF Transcript_25876/g.32965 Transcript_25876/m.32965 type:complete len:81 (+) Transcript_25876:503-745(+)
MSNTHGTFQTIHKETDQQADLERVQLKLLETKSFLKEFDVSIKAKLNKLQRKMSHVEKDITYFENQLQCPPRGSSPRRQW